MLDQIERVMDAYDAGRLSRRRLIGTLGGLVATAIAGSTGGALAGEAKTTFRSTGLNHIALRVPDVARARQFYVKQMGLNVLSESEYNCFMACGGNQFVALFRSERPGLDHYCYTIENYDAANAVETLRLAGLEPERHEDRVYFKDLNDLTVQVSGQWDDYPGPRP